MHVLALETTQRQGSVAALHSGELLVEHQLPPDRRSAQTLAPAIAELLAEVHWQPSDVQLIATPSGPGSFTGLRVGVATAKTLAYALGCELLGVNTLEVIAAAAGDFTGRLRVISNAERNQLFAADGPGASDSQDWNAATRIVDIEDWLTSLRSGDTVTGPALEKLADRLPPGVKVVAHQQWAPRASSVGSVAWQHYETGRRDDVLQMVPQYFRQSAAEEKLDPNRQS